MEKENLTLGKILVYDKGVREVKENDNPGLLRFVDEPKTADDKKKVKKIKEKPSQKKAVS